MKFQQIFKNHQQINDIKYEKYEKEKYDEKQVNFYVNLNDEAELKSIYEYSQRNVLMAQEMVMQQNYFVPMNENQSLKQSRQLEAQSYRVSRPLYGNQTSSLTHLQRLVLQNNHGQNYKHEKLDQKQLDQKLDVDSSENNQEKNNKNKKNFNREKQVNIFRTDSQKRISIFLQQDKGANSYNRQLRNGLIPLRSNIKAQSLVINTYRQLKQRYESLDNQKEKVYKKKEVKKDENNRFKGTPITYDYNGEPIPLKNYKKHVISNAINNNYVNKNSESITMIPLAQNIILPSTTNKKRLEKRKARYLNEQEEKQNLRKSHQQQKFITSQGSQFLKKIPVDIQKSKLFCKQRQLYNNKKSLNQTTFSEFKRYLNEMRSLNNCQFQPKSQKNKLSNLSDVKQEIQHKKSIKKACFNQGKVIMNEKIFQSVFNCKPNKESEFLQQIQQEENNQFKYLNNKESIIKSKHPTFYQKQKQIIYDKKKCETKSMHVQMIQSLNKQIKSQQKRKSIENESINKEFKLLNKFNIQKENVMNNQNRKKQIKNFHSQQKTSIFRSSLKVSPKKTIQKRNISMDGQQMMRNSLQVNYHNVQVNNKNKPEIKSILKRQNYERNGQKSKTMFTMNKQSYMNKQKKLKTRPSSKYLQNE